MRVSPRRRAREFAVQALYQVALNKIPRARGSATHPRKQRLPPCGRRIVYRDFFRRAQQSARIYANHPPFAGSR